MNSVIISTSDISGGAARSAYRLHDGLRKIGIDSKMIVQEKHSTDFTVLGPDTDFRRIYSLLRRILDRTQQKFYAGRAQTPLNFAWLPGKGVLRKIEYLNPDIVNLHWIGRGIISIESIQRIRKPIIWTLQDMWVFTGGCHYDAGCGKYKFKCGECPLLGSRHKLDITRVTWQRKKRSWQNINMIIVAPTRWLAKCSRESSLFSNYRIEVIPFGLNLETFKPINQFLARDILKLPQQKRIILFGALQPGDLRKGFNILISALEKLKDVIWLKDNIILVVFGANDPLGQLPFPTYYLGKKNDDETLALIYSSANVMVVPSIQEAFGQTASESLACGTPVVSFAGTGVGDIVAHLQNGFLAPSFDPQGLADGIMWVLEDEDRFQMLSYNARKIAETEFELEDQAKKYRSLFKELLAGIEIYESSQ